MGRLDRSPTPFHACATAAEALVDAGFVERDETSSWTGSLPDRWFVRRGGSLIAARWPSDLDPTAPLRLVGAHTDSPNLRLKPHPDTTAVGWQRLAVEVYGGALFNSWLDRDLGLAGRVAVQRDDGVALELVHLPGPVARIPQLAIHLDREVNQKGLVLNPQQHLLPLWAPTGADSPREVLAASLGAEPDQLVAWDLMLHDHQPAALVGTGEDLLASARLDDLASCFVALDALVEVPEDAPVAAVICLYDHEEVGSVSRTGADGDLLPGVVARIHRAHGGDPDDLARALAGSACVSADMAHATHPNYPERHDPGHDIDLNGGPVVKVNASQRYASDAASAAPFLAACAEAGVPTQRFVSRSDLPCGSTIGPVTAARTGVSTVDVGIALLGMHSARETAGARDPLALQQALAAFLAGSG